MLILNKSISIFFKVWEIWW